jgi:hypothetical protein
MFLCSFTSTTAIQFPDKDNVYEGGWANNWGCSERPRWATEVYDNYKVYQCTNGFVVTKKPNTGPLFWLSFKDIKNDAGNPLEWKDINDGGVIWITTNCTAVVENISPVDWGGHKHVVYDCRGLITITKSTKISAFAVSDDYAWCHIIDGAYHNANGCYSSPVRIFEKHKDHFQVPNNADAASYNTLEKYLKEHRYLNEDGTEVTKEQVAKTQAAWDFCYDKYMKGQSQEDLYVQARFGACTGGFENDSDSLHCYQKSLFKDLVDKDKPQVSDPVASDFARNLRGKVQNDPSSIPPKALEVIDACLDGQSKGQHFVPPDSTDPTNEKPTCESSGGSMGWILCPVVFMVGGAVDAMMGMIDGQLNYQKLNDNKDTVRNAWSEFIPIANIAFAIVFLIIIYSTAVGGKTN